MTEKKPIIRHFFIMAALMLGYMLIAADAGKSNVTHTYFVGACILAALGIDRMRNR